MNRVVALALGGLFPFSMSALAAAQDFEVQWPESAGGNGHWYALVEFSEALSWDDAQDQATAMGGHLATFTSAPENEFFVSSLQGDETSVAWFGLQQNLASPDFEEPAGGWEWVTGESMTWAHWNLNEPNNAGNSDEHWANIWIDANGGNEPVGTWNDYRVVEGPMVPNAFVIEWDTDCNGDGVVDYGQILAGELNDLNGDGVPDTCDCRADINGDGAVTGADLGILLALWGDPSTLPSADVSGDGRLDGADLGLLLAAWGPCE